MRSIHLLRHLGNKRILVRVDFNVPIKNGKVLEDARLRFSLPTIQYLLKKKAKIMLVTHLGRPDGKFVKELSVAPVAKRLERLMKKKISIITNFKSPISNHPAHIATRSIAGGQSPITILENIRFFPGEEKNDPAFAKELASLADIFVLDGFAVAHRDAASVSGVAAYLPSYAGLLLEQEIKGLDQLLKKPKHPFVAIIGGAKAETKIPVIARLLPVADTIAIGGTIVATLLKAKGYGVGASIVDTLMEQRIASTARSKKMLQSIDVVVGKKDGKNHRIVSIQKKPHVICGADEGIFDVGPKTLLLYVSEVMRAKTIVWNGALGLFEQKPYHTSTMALGKIIADRSKTRGVYSVIGGGETIQVMETLGRAKDISFVSTGGGAMLEYLAGERLPGIEAAR